jgi:hypothetical protein
VSPISPSAIQYAPMPRSPRSRRPRSRLDDYFRNAERLPDGRAADPAVRAAAAGLLILVVLVVVLLKMMGADMR